MSAQGWDGKLRVADYRRVGIVVFDDAGAELRPGDPEHEAFAAEVESALVHQHNLGADPAEIPTARWEPRPEVLQ